MVMVYLTKHKRHMAEMRPNSYEEQSSRKKKKEKKEKRPEFPPISEYLQLNS